MYKPVQPADPSNVTEAERRISFQPRPGVALYGGFDGGETLRGERDPATNLTVLSGDIDDNDTIDADGITTDADDIQGSNTGRVIFLDGTDGVRYQADTIINGFTITAGKADLRGAPGGGGLACYGEGKVDDDGIAHGCSPSIADVTFIGNYALIGGAAYNTGYMHGSANASFLRVVFRGNVAYQSGGAVFNNAQQGGEASPTLVDVKFVDNRALFYYGGAMASKARPGLNTSGASGPVIVRATFDGNSAHLGGGALYNYMSSVSTVSVQVTNSTFVRNHADLDGGVFYNEVKYGSGQSMLRLVNVTLTGNSAGRYGGAVYGKTDNGSTTDAALDNVILWGNSAANDGGQLYNAGSTTATIDHSVVQGGCPHAATCTGLVVEDPMLGTLADNGGFTPTRLPAATSPAVDTANGANCPTTDQRSIPRPQGSHCDIGAVEVAFSPVLTVSDGNDYARYGQVVHYLVTLQNPSSEMLSGMAVQALLPPQLDAGATHWICLDPASQCSASGNGTLSDNSVNLPPHGSVTWQLSAPVRNGADETGGIQMQVDAQRPSGYTQTASDTDTLGLFRDGFDVTGANGTNLRDAKRPKR